MEKVERLIIKLAIVQFIFLFLAQFFFHHLDLLPEIKELAKYEGVNENTMTEILQTLKDK